MLKIELLLSKDEKATQVIADALQAQIQKVLTPKYPDLFVRVRVRAGKKCEISCSKQARILGKRTDDITKILLAAECFVRGHIIELFTKVA